MIDPKEFRFTGHQTFSYRYTWPLKVYNSLSDGREGCIFSTDDAIVTFGVGKNMVGAIKHWAHASGLIERGKEQSSWKLTKFGEKLLGELDPFMGHSATPWLLHWELARSPVTAVIYWLFNYFSEVEFSIDTALSELQAFLRDHRVEVKSSTTLQRDLDCAFRTYLQKKIGAVEDEFESPLAEIRLLEMVPASKRYLLVRNERSLLPEDVFALALIDFWNQHYKGSKTLSFEAAMFRPGSPGLIFRLNESGMARRVHHVGKLTGGNVSWSETAGLRQWQMNKKVNRDDLLARIYA